MRRPLLAATAVAVLLVGACSDDGDDDAGATTTTATTATTLATTTSTTLVQTPLPTGREAIDAVLAAWRAGDQAAALLVASPDAVAALFAIPAEAGEDRGCNSSNVQVNVQCVFRLSSGELQVRAAPVADGTGFLVDFVLLGT